MATLSFVQHDYANPNTLIPTDWGLERRGLTDLISDDPYYPYYPQSTNDVRVIIY
jgi:hypothetical protein